MARPAVNSTLPENGQTTVKAAINLNYVVHGLDASVSTQNPELEYNFKSTLSNFIAAFPPNQIRSLTTRARYCICLRLLN